MSIVATYKFTHNPQEASVGADGVVDWSRAKAAVSEYDSVAITLARQIADAAGCELIGISAGGKDVAASMAKKNALSKGLDRALVAADDAIVGKNATEVAAILAGLVREIGDVQLVVTGDASLDDGLQMMAGLIAGHLGWPAFQNIVEVVQDGAQFQLTQRIAGGTQVLKVTGPLVIAAASDAVSAKVPSMKDILAAGKKPLDTATVAVDSLGTAVAGYEKPVAVARKNQIFKGAGAVEDFVAAVKADGVL